MNKKLLKKIIQAKTISFNNECGGTEMSDWYKSLKDRTFKVVIDSALDDYETGINIQGHIIDPETIALIKKAARTKYATKEQKAKHDPTKVYVSEFDLV